MFQQLDYQHHTCIHILTCETLCTNDLNLVQCHETSVITYAQQPILPTILKLQVLYLLCQQAAFLRVLALQLVDVLLNLLLSIWTFGCLGGRFGRHLASCIVSTFALQESKLSSCMSTALEHFFKLRICSKLQNGAGSPAHLSRCVKCWRMSSSLDTSATSLSESVKGAHSSPNLLSTCSLPVFGQRQILSVSTLPLLYTQRSRITLPLSRCLCLRVIA